MSGTSMDGINVALIKTDGITTVEEIGDDSIAYTREFHQLLKATEYIVRTHKGNMVDAQKADFTSHFRTYLTKIIGLNEDEAHKNIQDATLYLAKKDRATLTLTDVIQHSTDLHAQAIFKLLKKLNMQAQNIDVIGYHGQTFFHAPALKITIQAGNGQCLSNTLQIPVIDHFRENDVAAGGQGAPFAPLYHQALAVRDNMLPVAVVNCGGIANITIIWGKTFDDICAYDTGPGNGLIDLFVKQRTQFAENMDLDGKYGLQGHINPAALEKLYEKSITIEGKNFFDGPILKPKSLDVNDLKLIPELTALNINDGCATLEAFTADTITRGPRLTPNFPSLNFILAGGGWHNPVIKRELEQRIKNLFGPNVKINVAEEIGWNNAAMEAQTFAYLAVRSLKGLPLSLPQTTNAPQPLSGGQLHKPQQGPH